MQKTYSQIEVEGFFQKDSMNIGEVVLYSLKCKHPANIEVFFPDKNYNYGNFKFVENVYFPTKTIGKISTDSAVYSLRSFEINPVQQLKLAVFVKSDLSSKIFADSDSLVFNNELDSNFTINTKLTPPALPLKTNYWYLFAKVTFLTFLIFIWWQIYGNVIERQFRAYSLYRRYNSFLADFKKQILSGQKTKMEQAYKNWKKYIGSFHNEDFSTLTSSEIANTFDRKPLAEALGNLDQAIYGNTLQNNMESTYQTLKQIAKELYQKKFKELMNKRKI